MGCKWASAFGYENLRIGPSNRQAFATFRAATSNHLPTGTSGHASTKPVGTLTTNFARLIRALHDESRC
jgi:hypothetical protein